MSRKKEPTYITEQHAFPQRLQQLMKEHGTTQKQLGTAIGKRPQTVSLYACGQSSPDADTIRAISDYYNVSADWLLGRPGSVMTIDTDLQAVCQYTGLSEKAVQTLHDSTDEDKELAAFLANRPFFTNGVSARIEWLVEEQNKLISIHECVLSSAMMKWQGKDEGKSRVIRAQLRGINGGSKVILPATDGARYYRQEAIDVFSSIVDTWIEDSYNSIIEKQEQEREIFKDWDRGDTDADNPQDAE